MLDQIDASSLVPAEYSGNTLSISLEEIYKCNKNTKSFHHSNDSKIGGTMFVKLKSFTLLAFVTYLSGCAGSALGNLTHKHPTQADVDAMVIGKTTRSEVEAKFSGFRTTIANGQKCDVWASQHFVTGAVASTFLCFDEKNILVQKYNQ